MIIRRFECPDVNVSRFAFGAKMTPSPAQALSAKADGKDVGHKPRPSSVAIREWMDTDQRVVESNRDFVGRIGFIF